MDTTGLLDSILEYELEASGRGLRNQPPSTLLNRHSLQEVRRNCLRHF